MMLGITIFIIPYLMGGMGAGDAKLMGGVGAVLGPKGVFIAALFTAIIGGVYALILLFVSRGYVRDLISRPVTTLKLLVFTGHLNPIPASKEKQKPKLYYGVAIALGTLLYMVLQWSGNLWILN